MKRLNKLNLDKKDRQLLFLLDVDGRTNYSQLAKKTRISKQLVKYRIKRLENEGFIKGYYTMIDTSRLGFTTFRVYLKFRNITHEKKDRIITYMKNKKNIWAVVLMAGKWDVALGIAVRDIYEFYEIWDKILEEYLELISEYKISIYSPIYHYLKKYLFTESSEKFKVRILGGNEKVKYDAKDIKILLALSKNARISLLDLSNILKSTPEAISYRIKRLEKEGIIQGYRAMIDVHKLNYEFYKVEIRLSNYKNIDKIYDFCLNHPNIYQIDKTIGGETLEIEFHVISLKEMLNIIDELQRGFPKTIEKFDYITVLSEEKTTYMPEIN